MARLAFNSDGTGYAVIDQVGQGTEAYITNDVDFDTIFSITDSHYKIDSSWNSSNSGSYSGYTKFKGKYGFYFLRGLVNLDSTNDGKYYGAGWNFVWITSGNEIPTITTNSTTATITFPSITFGGFSKYGFYYSIDGRSYSATTSSTITITGLSVGSHSITYCPIGRSGTYSNMSQGNKDRFNNKYFFPNSNSGTTGLANPNPSSSYNSPPTNFKTLTATFEIKIEAPPAIGFNWLYQVPSSEKNVSFGANNLTSTTYQYYYVAYGNSGIDTPQYITTSTRSQAVTFTPNQTISVRVHQYDKGNNLYTPIEDATTLSISLLPDYNIEDVTINKTSTYTTVTIPALSLSSYISSSASIRLLGTITYPDGTEVEIDQNARLSWTKTFSTKGIYSIAYYAKEKTNYTTVYGINNINVITFSVGSTFSEWIWNKNNNSENNSFINTNYPQATPTQLYAAYTAVAGTPRGSTRDFARQVWNDICQKAGEVTSQTNSAIVAVQMNINSPDYLTAAKFNTVAGWVGYTPIDSAGNAVTKGSRMLGRYFTELTDAINNKI